MPVASSETVAAVIPCLNEAGHIGRLLAATLPHVRRVVVVDDGSTDTTTAEAKAAGAEVRIHGRNLGKGAALLTGFAAAKEAGCTWAVILDADGQHDPAEIPLLLRRARETNADLVIGDRGLAAAPMSTLRRKVNRRMSRWLSQRAGMELPDSQCGFRLVRLAALEEMTFRTRHFEFESELLLNFVHVGRRMIFAPVTPRPATRPSRIRPLRDTWRWCRWWWTTRRPDR